MTRILVLGMSHLRALRSAVTTAEDHFLEIVGLRSAPDIMDQSTLILRMEGRQWQSPDVVCLSLDRNLHNVFSLKENPEKFRVGDAVLGSVPPVPPDHSDQPTRRFVPRDMLQVMFQRRLRREENWTRIIHDYFPKARFIYLSGTPPPLDLPPVNPDQPATQNTLMAHFVNADIAPSPLRMKIFDVQTDVYTRWATAFGAVFLEPPAAALTQDGFLDAPFWATGDPTHGNAAYGRLVIEQIKAVIGMDQDVAATGESA